MSDANNVIDARLRFARSNPELLAFAQQAAPGAGRGVDELLRDAIARVRAELEPDDAARTAAG